MKIGPEEVVLSWDGVANTPFIHFGAIVFVYACVSFRSDEPHSYLAWNK